MIFPLSLATIGLGFIGHELAHRYVALRFGYYAKFVMWKKGLLLALFMALASGGRIIFAAPGAVYIHPRVRRVVYGFEEHFYARREMGIIALSGPLTNIIIAIIFYFLSQWMFLFNEWIFILSLWMFRTNLVLAAFNMIPFPPMDGSKIFAWNKMIWAVTGLPLWIFTLIFVF